MYCMGLLNKSIGIVYELEIPPLIDISRKRCCMQLLDYAGLYLLKNLLHH